MPGRIRAGGANMTRQEFLDTLARILNRELSEAEVADNIRYYEEYMDQEIRNGRTEAEVLASLGDPRLIARTILQVDEIEEEQDAAAGFGRGRIFMGGTPDDDAETVYTDGPKESVRDKVRTNAQKIKGILILIAVLAVVFLILGTVFKILWSLLPVLLIVGVGMWIYNRFF